MTSEFIFAVLACSAMVVALACVISFVRIRRELQSQITELRAAMVSAARTSAAIPKMVVPKPEFKKVEVAPTTRVEVVSKVEEISSETLAMIAAGVAAFLGKTARVRGARLLPDEPSAWAQQGRVYIQASHNL